MFAAVALRTFPGGQSFEFCHYGEIGRRLARGEGPRTEVLYPAEAALLAARGTDLTRPVPPLGRFPLFAFLVSAAELALGATDAAVLAASGAALAGAAAAAAWTLAPLLGAQPALCAALLFALSPSMTRGFALWGTPDLLFAALLLPFHAAWLARADARRTGLLAGLCWLARPNFILFLPVYALQARREARWAARAAAWAALCAAPWALWQLWAGGTLLNPNLIWNLAGGALTPEPGWHYARVFSWADFGAGHAGALAAKAARGWSAWLAAWPALWQMGPLLPLAAWGLWAGRRDPWWRLHLALLALQAAVFGALRVESLGAHVAGRYELWFAPVLAGAAALGAGSLRAPRWAAPAALALMAAWYGRFYALPELGFGHPAGLPPAWPELRALPQGADYVATNIPAHVGWYAGRKAVLAPADAEEFARLRGLLPVGPVLISTLPVGELAAMPYWLSLLRSRDETERFCARFGYRVAYASPQALVLVPSALTGT